MNIAFFPMMIVSALPIVLVVILLVAAWRAMKAHESIAKSLKTLAENQRSGPIQE